MCGYQVLTNFIQLHTVHSCKSVQ